MPVFIKDLTWSLRHSAFDTKVSEPHPFLLSLLVMEADAGSTHLCCVSIKQSPNGPGDWRCCFWLGNTMIEGHRAEGCGNGDLVPCSLGPKN